MKYVFCNDEIIPVTVHKKIKFFINYFQVNVSFL